MPDCYYVVTSSPENAARDLRACVREGGFPASGFRFAYDSKRVHAFVSFKVWSDAVKYLDPLKDCLESKDHVVHEYKILHEFGSVGLADDPDAEPPAAV